MKKENLDQDALENEVVNDPAVAEEPQAVVDESFEQTDNSADAVSEWQDKYIRLSAEFDNYRKRTLKEKIELIATAGEDVVKAILPVVDDMERAIVMMKSDDREGVELIYHKFVDILKTRGVNAVEALEQALDTDYHDAIANVPAPTEVLKGKIIDVVQKGYKMNDKVIRFAKVVVGE